MSTKKSVFLKVISVFMVLALCFSMVMPVFAASKTVSVTSSTSKKTVTVVTGKGLQYSLGLKKTTVTIKNTGKYPVAVYTSLMGGYVYVGNLSSGQSKTLTAKGSGKTYYVYLQKAGRSSTNVKITTSAGSVY